MNAHVLPGYRAKVPTANISVAADRALPDLGVYATRAQVAGRVWVGATNIGRRPTFDAGHISIETYLLDFEGDVYGERMDLEILARIRGEVKFDGISELKAQIAKDVDVVRDLVSTLDTALPETAATE